MDFGGHSEVEVWGLNWIYIKKKLKTTLEWSLTHRLVVLLLPRLRHRWHGNLSRWDSVVMSSCCRLIGWMFWPITIQCTLTSCVISFINLINMFKHWGSVGLLIRLSISTNDYWFLLLRAGSTSRVFRPPTPLGASVASAWTNTKTEDKRIKPPIIWLIHISDRLIKRVWSRFSENDLYSF